MSSPLDWDTLCGMRKHSDEDSNPYGRNYVTYRDSNGNTIRATVPPVQYLCCDDKYALHNITLKYVEWLNSINCEVLNIKNAAE